MRVIFKTTIIERIAAASVAADRDGKKIDVILLTKDEFVELWKQTSASGYTKPLKEGDDLSGLRCSVYGITCRVEPTVVSKGTRTWSMDPRDNPYGFRTPREKDCRDDIKTGAAKAPPPPAAVNAFRAYCMGDICGCSEMGPCFAHR